MSLPLCERSDSLFGTRSDSDSSEGEVRRKAVLQESMAKRKAPANLPIYSLPPGAYAADQMTFHRLREFGCAKRDSGN